MADVMTLKGARRGARKYEEARPEFERRNADFRRREFAVAGLPPCDCGWPSFPIGGLHEPGCTAVMT
jgi:hypothetical protein